MDTHHSDQYAKSSLQLQFRDTSVSFENNNSVLDKHDITSPQYFADIVEMGATDPDAMEYVLSVMKEAKEKVRKFEESRKDRRPGDSPVSTGKRNGKSSRPSNDDGGNGISDSTPATTTVPTVAVATSTTMQATPTMVAIAPTSATVPAGMFLVPMHPHPMVFPPFTPAVPPVVAPAVPPPAPAANLRNASLCFCSCGLRPGAAQYQDYQ
uniref:Uncharacterized protein n=1 Tax=Oryza nivara TaxID=4536 RepID=A0A0E0H245_ORYNI